MKVLYLHQYFSTPESTGGTRSYEMARRLVLRGHEVTMITSSASLPGAWECPPGWSERNVEGIRLLIYHLPYSNKIPFAKRLFIFFKFMLVSALKAIRVECDVVFATSTPLTISVPGVLASKWNRVPFVFEVRDLWPDVPIALNVLKGRFARWVACRLERWAYANARRVVALSPGIADGVVRTGYPREEVAIIPNAADVDSFSVPEEAGRVYRERYAWLKDRPFVVYTGTFGLVNDLSYLVDVAAAMTSLDPEVRFAIVGDGLEKEKLVDYAVRRGVLDVNFFILPPVPKRDVPQILSAADFAVSTVLPKKELWDNSANKFFDALAAGRPIAINYEGWQAEIVRTNEVGVVMDSGDPVAGAESLRQRLADTSWCMASRERARQLAEDVFCREIQFDMLDKLLRETLQSQV